jgi:hypothetical protein
VDRDRSQGRLMHTREPTGGPREGDSHQQQGHQGACLGFGIRWVWVALLGLVSV